MLSRVVFAIGVVLILLSLAFYISVLNSPIATGDLVVIHLLGAVSFLLAAIYLRLGEHRK